MDLQRPRTAGAAPHESAILKRDFFNSLLAAFTVEEVTKQLDAAGLHGCACTLVSERHWLVLGRAR